MFQPAWSVTRAGGIEAAVLIEHGDAFDDARMAYMRGCACHKARDFIGAPAAKRTFDLGANQLPSFARCVFHSACIRRPPFFILIP
jgi:hypothetical protein